MYQFGKLPTATSIIKMQIVGPTYYRKMPSYYSSLYAWQWRIFRSILLQIMKMQKSRIFSQSSNWLGGIYQTNQNPFWLMEQLRAMNLQK
jgi:hypothetical protein